MKKIMIVEVKLGIRQSIRRPDEIRRYFAAEARQEIRPNAVIKPPSQHIVAKRVCEVSRAYASDSAAMLFDAESVNQTRIRFCETKSAASDGNQESDPVVCQSTHTRSIESREHPSVIAGMSSI